MMGIAGTSVAFNLLLLSFRYGLLLAVLPNLFWAPLAFSGQAKFYLLGVSSYCCICLLSMHSMMSNRSLRLSLDISQSLPTQSCWHLCAGFLRATALSPQGEAFTLAIWGPGDIVDSEIAGQHSSALQAVSPAVISECSCDDRHRHAFSSDLMRQLVTFLGLARMRPAEARLLTLLIWLSERFGSSADCGRYLPLETMNLTHRQLAEMASVSRVTVTKSLGLFRQQGWIRPGESGEILVHHAVDLLMRL